MDYENNCKFRRAYVFHRGRYIQFDLFADPEVGKYVFCHFASKPKLDDNIIFTLEPSRNKDVYGFGKYEKNEKILRVCKQFVSCLQENRFYYASNRVGSLIDDYIKNISLTDENGAFVNPYSYFSKNKNNLFIQYNLINFAKISKKSLPCNKTQLLKHPAFINRT